MILNVEIRKIESKKRKEFEKENILAIQSLPTIAFWYNFHSLVNVLNFGGVKLYLYFLTSYLILIL